MSSTIFLNPVTLGKKVILIQAKNTSDQLDFDLEPSLKQAIAAKGYQVVDDPNKAYYILQANVLQVAEADPSAAEQALWLAAAPAVSFQRLPTRRSRT